MIKIKEDYRFFTHLTGKESVIPLSKAILKAFPSRLEISASENKKVIDLCLEGEVKGFTHLLNIEKARVEVFGKAKDYFHFFLFAKGGKIYLKLHRGEMNILVDGILSTLKNKGQIALMETKTLEKPEQIEKISFGCAKKPLLEKSIERGSKIYMLAQLMLEEKSLDFEIAQIEPLLVDLLSPKDKDYEHRNLNLRESSFDPFALFQAYRDRMKEYIVTEEGNATCFLKDGKKLPHAGRALGMKMKDFSFDILWKKGKVVKLAVYPHTDCNKIFILGKKFRVKGNPNDRGRWQDSSQEIILKNSSAVYIDRIAY